jgi:hypothetical protein
VLLKKEIESIKYGSSIEALDDLLNSSQVIEISTSLSHLANGIEYSFVEVTCSDGVQYGLQAYGNEAFELNRLALESVPKEELAPVIIS